ncbi:acidic leucine-rich nuclear phosphoprotein 32 family member A-like [Coccinella septempunctata]|uniref:acidic leucine-rich nuclear phosphoprotein 32 family member A-like n=1 Tax=Coccinella septempunctata TaxID=41139 RepID=UPI001D0904DF|nr:acidic leucine-rich nuclear phosphoprotein 32 family member A-like [Coccinella septempunctata]
MEKRVWLEKRGRDPAKIRELNLDNCRSTSIVGLTDELCNLEILTIVNVGLTSLKGFPKLPNLKKLYLSDNRINSGLNLLETSPKLTRLNLSGNEIKDLETLEPLKNFKNLISLDLFSNQVTIVENYRDAVFKTIPSLKYLDGFDKNDRHVEDSDDEVDWGEIFGEFEESEDWSTTDEEEEGNSSDEAETPEGRINMEKMQQTLKQQNNAEDSPLKCAVCKHHLSISPIVLNTVLGSICGRDACKRLASSQGTNYRQKAYEGLAKVLEFPCMYKENGCKKVLPWNEIGGHELICEFVKL